MLSFVKSILKGQANQPIEKKVNYFKLTLQILELVRHHNDKIIPYYKSIHLSLSLSLSFSVCVCVCVCVRACVCVLVLFLCRTPSVISLLPTSPWKPSPKQLLHLKGINSSFPLLHPCHPTTFWKIFLPHLCNYVVRIWAGIFLKRLPTLQATVVWLVRRRNIWSKLGQSEALHV